MRKSYEFEEGLSLTYGDNNLTLTVIPGSRTQSSTLMVVAEEIFATDPEDAIGFILDESDVLDLIGHLLLAYGKMRK